MHVSFEYILSGLIIFLILITTEVTMFTFVSQTLTSFEQENNKTP
jgi:hypothetical protein